MDQDSRQDNGAFSGILLFSMNPLRPTPKLTEIPTLIRTAPAMFRDLLARRYRPWPAGTLVGGLLGFLYLINPLDLIPEALPVVGIVDDTLVLGVFLAFLSRDVKKYVLWKSSSENTNSPTQKT